MAHMDMVLNLPRFLNFFFRNGWILGDGVQGGTSSTIYYRWQMGSDYDGDIAQGINCSCFL